MRQIALALLIVTLTLVGGLQAQVTYNPVPPRIIGHAQLPLTTGNPNLVEGRELLSPQGVALDTTANPPILYVADALNNRVLGWRDGVGFANGAFADVVIGQRDKFSTFQLGPGTSFSGGLYLPTGLAVDKDGNLFVADSGNNRILRYPKPFAQPDPVKSPDLVLGQSSLTSRTSNAGGRSAQTLALFTAPRVIPTQMAFDSQGNFYSTDPGNGRVLRYPAASVQSGATTFGPPADLVLGQTNFSTDPQNPASVTDLSKLLGPAGIGIDPAGRLYVSDAVHRVLVWELPHNTSGRAANRLIGGVLGPQGTNRIAVPPQLPTDLSLDTPEGIFFVGDNPYVVDTGNNRILRYDAYTNWPASAPPPAKGVLGQNNFADFQPNRSAVIPVTERVSLSQPVTAVFSGRLYVVDSQNHRLLVLPDAVNDTLASPARVLGQAAPDGQEPNLTEGREFNFASLGAGVAVDRNSNPPHLYVADTANNRVLCFRDARNLRPGDKADLVIGQPGFSKTLVNYPHSDTAKPSANNLFQPTGVIVDAAGNLYVADTGNGRVLRFPKPFVANQNQPNADLVLGKQNFTQSVQAAPDPSSRNMREPYGLALVGQDGWLLVSDRAFNRVLFFLKPAGGDFISGQAADKAFGQPDFFSTASGSALNRLNGPRHISSDTDDRLYVCDTGNQRVQIFDRAPAAGPDPNAAITLPIASGFPHGIFVSSLTGDIWVATQNQFSAGGQLRQYRKFNDLVLNPNPEVTLSTSEQPLAITLDSFGNMMAAYGTNRVAMYFAAATPANAGSYLPRIAPGMIAALYPLDQFSSRFGQVTAAATTVPLPTELGDLQVLVNDQPAPLFFVSPDQINFQVPMGAPSSGSTEIQVVRKSTGQIVAVGCSAVRVGTKPDGTQRWSCTAGGVLMDVASPALFAGPGYSAGSGQIAALNEDNTINSSTNPISRGKVIQLFGTGQGFVPGAPPDGAAPTGAIWTPDRPRVIVGTDFVTDSDIQYSGLAPYLVGVWQLNVRIPERVAPSNQVLVVIVHRSIPSNNPQVPGQIVATIAVKQ